jgi:hypothetical protein
VFTEHALDRLAEHHPYVDEDEAMQMWEEGEELDPALVGSLTHNVRRASGDTVYRLVRSDDGWGILCMDKRTGRVVTYLRLDEESKRILGSGPQE